MKFFTFFYIKNLKFLYKYIRKFKATFKNALTCQSGAQMRSLAKKTFGGLTSREAVPLSCFPQKLYLTSGIAAILYIY